MHAVLCALCIAGNTTKITNPQGQAKLTTICNLLYKFRCSKTRHTRDIYASARHTGRHSTLSVNVTCSCSCSCCGPRVFLQPRHSSCVRWKWTNEVGLYNRHPTRYETVRYINDSETIVLVFAICWRRIVSVLDCALSWIETWQENLIIILNQIQKGALIKIIYLLQKNDVNRTNKGKKKRGQHR